MGCRLRTLFPPGRGRHGHQSRPTTERRSCCFNGRGHLAGETAKTFEVVTRGGLGEGTMTTTSHRAAAQSSDHGSPSTAKPPRRRQQLNNVVDSDDIANRPPGRHRVGGDGILLPRAERDHHARGAGDRHRVTVVAAVATSLQTAWALQPRLTGVPIAMAIIKPPARGFDRASDPAATRVRRH